VTGDLVLLVVLGLALAGNLYVSMRTLGHTRQLIAQVAVLTLRVTDVMDIGEAIQRLDADLRVEQAREP